MFLIRLTILAVRTLKKGEKGVSATEHERWKFRHKIDVILSIVVSICLIYLLPAIFFICKSFFRGEINLSEMGNWVNSVLRISNDFWFGLIKGYLVRR